MSDKKPIEESIVIQVDELLALRRERDAAVAQRDDALAILERIMHENLFDLSHARRVIRTYAEATKNPRLSTAEGGRKHGQRDARRGSRSPCGVRGSMMVYHVEIWYRRDSDVTERHADDSYTARTVEACPWGLYLAHSDYEAYIPAAHVQKFHVTELEES